MRTRRFLAASLFALVQIGFPVGINTNTKADLLYPKESIDENIAHLEAAAQRLMAQFGNTVDEATLLLLTRAVQAIEAMRTAYHDSLTSTLESLSKERQADFFSLETLVNDANDHITNSIGDIAAIEQRFSNTLIRVLRGSQAPWVLSYSPVSFLLERDADLPLRVDGQNLQSTLSRLRLSNHEIPALSATTNAVDFIIPKDFLTPDSDGLIHGTIFINSSEPVPFYKFWASSAIFEYSFFMRPLSKRIGTYSLRSKVVDASSVGESISRDGQIFSTSVDGPEQSDTEEFCTTISDLQLQGKWTFETSKTKIVTTLNERRGKHLFCLTSFGDFRDQVFRKTAQDKGIDCNRTSYPNSNPQLTLNNPDKLCMQLTATSQGSNQYDFASAEIDARFRYSVHRSEPSSSEFEKDGILQWKEDQDIRLPEGHQGFQLDVAFADSGEKRSFFGPGTYGPIHVFYDPNSNTVLIRTIVK
jgi:hypothetical protein